MVREVSNQLSQLQRELGLIKSNLNLAMSIPMEDCTSHLRSMYYLGAQRPWLNLYGVRIRPVAPYGSATSRPDPALIHQCLPDELLFEIFSRMSPYNLGKAACVCRKWRYTIRNPILWRSACLKAWQMAGVSENCKMVQTMYDGSWRKMWLSRPRIRTDGLYVSRNTYIRTGTTGWKVTNPVHLVCYFRYIRFFANGKFLYKNSSQKVKEVVRFMNLHAAKVDKVDCVFKGHYTLTNDQVETAILYPGLRPTIFRMRLRIRGTTLGANNRLDPLAFVTTGINNSEINQGDNMLDAIDGWQENETHNPDVPAISHQRGLAPFVFVPFEEVETSVLNLPVDKMDYYVPG